MPSEFDAYASSYKEIINRGAAITGESFEYFIGVRVDLVLRELEKLRAPVRDLEILDFGCGIGETARVLREKVGGAIVQGVDASERSLATARALEVPGASFHLIEGVRLPFEDSSFDLVYSNGTFHHIDRSEHPAALAEAARVLRPGGHAFIFENNPLNPLMVHNMRHNPFDANAKMLSPWYLRRMMRRAGLATQDPRYYAFFPKQLKPIRFAERYLLRVPLGAQYYVRGTRE
jgi:ubiquinone/menaquinone biosynthesis C-methylase UbiE